MSIQESKPSRPKENPSHEELTADAVYDILSNQRRRFVLYHLGNVGETSLRELSRLVAAWENGIDPEAVTSVQRKRVYTALHQTHLMRLDEYGVVQYDRTRGVVVPTDRLDVFEGFLADEETYQRPWNRYYGGLVAAGVVFAVAALFVLPTLGSLDAALVGLVLFGAVLAVARAQGSPEQGHSVPGDLPGLTPESRRVAGDE